MLRAESVLFIQGRSFTACSRIVAILLRVKWTRSDSNRHSYRFGISEHYGKRSQLMGQNSLGQKP